MIDYTLAKENLIVLLSESLSYGKFDVLGAEGGQWNSKMSNFLVWIFV